MRKVIKNESEVWDSVTRYMLHTIYSAEAWQGDNLDDNIANLFIESLPARYDINRTQFIWRKCNKGVRKAFIEGGCEEMN